MARVARGDLEWTQPYGRAGAAGKQTRPKTGAQGHGPLIKLEVAGLPNGGGAGVLRLQGRGGASWVTRNPWQDKVELIGNWRCRIGVSRPPCTQRSLSPSSPGLHG